MASAGSMDGMKAYEIVVRDDYCAVINKGEILWEGPNATALIEKLLIDMSNEHTNVLSLRQRLQTSEDSREKAHRLIKEYYIPGVSRVTAFLKQLLKDDGHCCMLGSKHVSDIKAMLGGN